MRGGNGEADLRVEGENVPEAEGWGGGEACFKKGEAATGPNAPV